jgi:hypothetical protein
MKYVTTILIASFFIVACHQSGKPVKELTKKGDSLKPNNLSGNYILSPYDTTGLLTKLFDPDTIIRKVALWEPDKDAEFNMIVSDDGYCHTRLDTIMTGPTDQAINYIVLFITEGYHGKENERDRCHACGVNYSLATLSTGLTSSQIPRPPGDEILYFNRNICMCGGWGTGGKVSVDSLGEIVLHISSKWTGTSVQTNHEDYFDLTNGRLIFTYVSLCSNEMNGDRNSGDFGKTSKDLIKLKLNNGWNDIQLKCQTEKWNTTEHKFINSYSNEYYRMNDDGTRYERIVKY